MSMEQIASEKAGIIKEKVPVILGPQSTLSGHSQAGQRIATVPVFVSKKISYFYDEEISAIGQAGIRASRSLILRSQPQAIG